MSEPMDTSPTVGQDPATSFGATDVRIPMAHILWAARERQQRGMATLNGDADLLLLADLENMTALSTPAPASSSQDPTETTLQELLDPLQPIVGTSHPAKATFSCTACSLVYKDKRKLRGHWEAVHSPNFMGFQFPQEGCSKTFHPQNKGFLRSHLRHAHQWSAEQVSQLIARRLPLVSVGNQASDYKNPLI